MHVVHSAQIVTFILRKEFFELENSAKREMNRKYFFVIDLKYDLLGSMLKLHLVT